MNYGIRLALIGDVTAQVAASDPFAAFVWASNRGDSLRFLADDAAVAVELTARAGRA